MRLKLFVLTSLLLLISFSSGCWDVEDIDRRATIIALGLDAAPNNQVMVSAQIPLIEISPLALGTEKPFHTITSQAKSSFGATAGLESKSAKSIFYGQLKTIVVNTALAERGLKYYCGFLKRFPQAPAQSVVVLTETTSQDILSVSLSSKFIPGFAIYNFFQAQGKSDEVYPIQVWQFIKDIEVRPIDAYLPIISYNKEEQVYRFDGIGVFHRDRLVGKLSENESRMAGLIMRKSRNAYLSVPVPKMGIVSYRRVAAKTKITILKTSPNLEFLVKVNASGLASDITSDKTNLNKKDIKEIERATERSLKKDMLETIDHLQKLNSDIIGFGDMVRGSKPGTWKHLNWDREYPRASFQVRVKFTLERVGEYR